MTNIGLFGSVYILSSLTLIEKERNIIAYECLNCLMNYASKVCTSESLSYILFFIGLNRPTKLVVKPIVIF